jgi:hypothetical protein
VLQKANSQDRKRTKPTKPIQWRDEIRIHRHIQPQRKHGKPIPEIKIETEAAYKRILTILGNQHFNEFQMETAWKLTETHIQPILTYGGETWKLNKKGQKPKPDTRKHHMKNSHGTPIDPNRTTIHRVRTAGHINDNYQKQTKHGKDTNKKTKQHDNNCDEQ